MIARTWHGQVPPLERRPTTTSCCERGWLTTSVRSNSPETAGAIQKTVNSGRCPEHASMPQPDGPRDRASFQPRLCQGGAPRTGGREPAYAFEQLVAVERPKA